MSITGAADGPSVPPRRRDRRHRLRHVRGVRRRRWRCSRASAPAAASRWTSRCSIRWPRCSPIRRATTSRAARCRRGWATAIRASCRTKRSPRRTASSCWPSATTISGGEFCDGRRPRRSDERFATNRQRVTGYDELRPIVADALRRRAAAVLDRRADRGRRAVRIGPRPAGAVRRSADRRPRDDRAARARDRSARCKVLGMPVKLSDTPGAVRTPPPTLGAAHATRCCERDLGLERGRRSRDCARNG